MFEDNAPRDAQGGNSVDDDSDLEFLLRRAGGLAQRNDAQGAEEVLKEGVEAFPDSPLPHHNLSVLYLDRLRAKMERVAVWEDLSDDESLFELAVREAENALEIDEEYIPARNNLAMLFALRGWWEDAEKQWEISLTLKPDQSQVRQDMLEARRRSK